MAQAVVDWHCCDLSGSSSDQRQSCSSAGIDGGGIRPSLLAAAAALHIHGGCNWDIGCGSYG